MVQPGALFIIFNQHSEFYGRGRPLSLFCGFAQKNRHVLVAHHPFYAGWLYCTDRRRQIVTITTAQRTLASAEKRV
jgi:hypothetical protein